MVKSLGSTLLGVVREHLSSADGAYTPIANSSLPTNTLWAFGPIGNFAVLFSSSTQNCRCMQGYAIPLGVVAYHWSGSCVATQFPDNIIGTLNTFMTNFDEGRK